MLVLFILKLSCSVHFEIIVIFGEKDNSGSDNSFSSVPEWHNIKNVHIFELNVQFFPTAKRAQCPTQKTELVYTIHFF